MLYHLRHWPSTTIINSMYTLQKRRLKFKTDRFILIACFPRSASNYLAYLISEATGYQRRVLKPEHGFFHDVIYLPKLIDQMLKKSVIDQHLRATSLTRTIFTELKIKPIILVRNIFDVVISYNDYISQRGYGPLDPDRKDLVPEFCKDYCNFADSKKYDYLIDTVIPWYITFYVSWYHYTFNANAIEAYWIKYEDMVSNPQKILAEVFSFYDLSIPPSKINSLLAQNEKVNYNVGIAGRGDRLSDIQKDKIKKLASYHSNINFSMIGL